MHVETHIWIEPCSERGRLDQVDVFFCIHDSMTGSHEGSAYRDHSLDLSRTVALIGCIPDDVLVVVHIENNMGHEAHHIHQSLDRQLAKRPRIEYTFFRTTRNFCALASHGRDHAPRMLMAKI